MVLMVVGVGLVVFSVGPMMYYRNTILGSEALWEKYATEGIRFSGRIVKKWKAGGNDSEGYEAPYSANVAYQVESSIYVRYGQTISLEQFENPTATMLDLIRLPNYPQSAIPYSYIQVKYPGFRPSTTIWIIVAYLWTLSWNLIPLAFLLKSVDACPYGTKLIGPIFLGLVAMEFFVGYFLVKWHRDAALQNTLYGAQVAGNSHMMVRESTPPPRVSYDEFCHSKDDLPTTTPTCLFWCIAGTILRDLGIFVAWVVVIPSYLIALGGGFVVCNAFVSAVWRIRLLEKYNDDSASTTVEGLVVCRRHSGAIVQYEVHDDYQIYEKWIPKTKLSDKPMLVYLTDLPRSAELKCRIDNLRHEQRNYWKDMFGGLLLMLLQVGFAAFVAGKTLPEQVGSMDPVISFAIAAGIATAAHLVFGFVCAMLYYQCVIRRELLYGGKQREDPLHDGTNQNEYDMVVVEEQWTC